MKIKLEKIDGEFSAKIVQEDETTIPFNYITFLKELYALKGVLETEYSEEIDENERKVMDDLFKRISEIFSEKDAQVEEEVVDY